MQKPEEKELSRINLFELFNYNDPLSSFLNILSGGSESKTVDGRRVYIMEKIDLDNKEKITIKIKDYQNIWADHKRNDLDKIEFF